jgi:hypothetical protein
MAWFRRRKRVDLGVYVAPEPVEPAPVERVVEDGLLIAESVIRMTLRNRIIVDALRDHSDFERDTLAGAAAREFDALADHEWETAERLRLRRETKTAGGPLADDDDEADSSLAAWRESSLGDLFDRARAEAWNEVAPVLLDRAGAPEPVVDDAYAREKAERVASLLALDFAELAHERGVEL